MLLGPFFTSVFVRGVILSLPICARMCHIGIQVFVHVCPHCALLHIVCVVRIVAAAVVVDAVYMLCFVYR